MHSFRFWLPASLALLVSGCQLPLFGNGFGSLWQSERSATADANRNDPGRNRPGGRGSRGAIQQVSAEYPAAAERQHRIYQLLSRGNQELTAGRFPDAQIYFGQVLDIDPSNFHAHHMLARIGDQTQDFEFAERHYLDALSANPSDPNLLSDMGYSYLLQGEYRYADTYLRRALSAKPNHVMAKRNLAALEAYQGNYPMALAWLNQVGTPQQAQATLQELMANRPPQFRLKNDPRARLPENATRQARELAARLVEAQERASYEKWKQEMAEWSQQTRERARAALSSTQPAFDPRQIGQGIPDDRLQQAMRAVEEDYNRRSRLLDQRSAIPPSSGGYRNPGPQSYDLSRQMRREATTPYPLPTTDRSGATVTPPQYLPQQYRPQTVPPQYLPRQELQPTTDPRGNYYPPPANGFQPQSGLSPMRGQAGVEILPAPADYRPSPSATGQPMLTTPGTGVFIPQAIPANGPVHTGTAVSPVNPADAAAARRALALGRSAGPGSLITLGADPRSASASAPQPTAEPQPHSFSGPDPVPIPSGAGQPAGSIRYVPGQPYFPPNGGASSLNDNWRDVQPSSPTFNYSTGQPINPVHNSTQPPPMPEAYQRGGGLSSPTTRPGFGQPPFVAREMQQLQPTANAGQTGPAAVDTGLDLDRLRAMHNRY